MNGKYLTALFCLSLLILPFSVSAQEMGSPCASLLAAATNANLDGMSAAIKAGADVNCTDENLNTALLLATPAANEKAFKLLLDARADVNMKNSNGTTPLMKAAKMGNLLLVKYFIRNGADPKLINSEGYTAYAIAQNNWNTEVANYLQPLTVKPPSTGSAPPAPPSCSPLLTAASSGDTAGISSSISAGTNVNCTDDNLNTPIILSVNAGCEKCVKILLDAGADVNMKNADGNTALMRAAKLSNLSMVKLLLKNNADATLINAEGNTALVVAQNSFNTEVANYLQQYDKKGFTNVEIPKVYRMPGVVNPAATLCENNGGNLRVITVETSGRQYTVCVFKSNKQCEVYALYYGTCRMGGVDISGYNTKEGVYCAISGGTYDAATTTCTTHAGNICSAQDYYALTCN